jgi:hypothetical protein
MIIIPARHIPNNESLSAASVTDESVSILNIDSETGVVTSEHFGIMASQLFSELVALSAQKEPGRRT